VSWYVSSEKAARTASQEPLTYGVLWISLVLVVSRGYIDYRCSTAPLAKNETLSKMREQLARVA
jgi:hypothetical protein